MQYVQKYLQNIYTVKYSTLNNNRQLCASGNSIYNIRSSLENCINALREYK